MMGKTLFKRLFSIPLTIRGIGGVFRSVGTPQKAGYGRLS